MGIMQFETRKPSKIIVHVCHYNGVIMGAITSLITSLTIVYSIVYSDADQRKHQSSASLAFVRRIHRGPVNSPHKWPVTRKMFPFDDVIMSNKCTHCNGKYIYTAENLSVLWHWFNSMSPWSCGNNQISVISEQMSQIKYMSTPWIA